MGNGDIWGMSGSVPSYKKEKGANLSDWAPFFYDTFTAPIFS